jgi:hypothetical protein
MKITDYFLSLPDESLIMLAANDWNDLEMLCYALTLDLYMFGKIQDYN